MNTMMWINHALWASVIFCQPLACTPGDARDKPEIEQSDGSTSTGNYPPYQYPDAGAQSDGASGSSSNGGASDEFGTPPPPTQDYVLDAETATSKTTGLIWLRTTLDTSKTGGSCVNRCEEHTAAGRDDWRAPTLAELKGILVDRPTCPHIDEDAFPLTLCSWYTSSDIAPGNGGYLMLSFYSGEEKSMQEVYIDTGFPCRCVR